MIKFVESLESHRAEWIDTGIEIKSGIRAEIEFEFTEIYNESWVMGGSNNPQRIGYFAGIFNNQLYTGNFASYSPDTLGVGIRVKAYFNVGYDISRTIYLFGRNWDNVANGFAKCKVYSFKAWYNNQLIANYVPAVNTTTGEAGMYDTISGTMHYNQGGGAFTPHEGWYIDDNGINNAHFNDMPSATEKPFPYALWRVEDDKVTSDLLGNDLKFGAFANATQLSTIRIPPSVKKIGMESFANTQLTSVTIARDCEYYETSFPKGCEINFYD